MEELLADLGVWRRQGVLRLQELRLPALGRAAELIGLAASSAEAAQPAVLTELLRSALERVAGSVSGRAALVLLGLDPNTFDLAPHLLREDAAEIYGVSPERFRREPQQQVLRVVANCLLELCIAHRARQARLAMERRHPADTRLAVHWLERFEAYFRIWAPVYGLGADLTAYRETLLDESRPWDRDPDPAVDGDSAYSQEMQAAGSATFALLHHAHALAAEKQFISRFGGLWLLSSAESEAEARDTLAASKTWLPTNERDESWLRTALEESGGEINGVLAKLQGDAIGLATHDEWQEWAGGCGCSWSPDLHDPVVEYFPTSRYHREIDPECLVHRTIEACGNFCALIEHEWLKVADWYQIGQDLAPTTQGSQNHGPSAVQPTTPTN